MKKLRTIKDLKQDAKNANAHTAKGKKLLATSLKDLGAGRSILADKDGNIIAGNATAEQALALGYKKIRVVQTTGDELVVVQRTDLDLDSAKARKLAIMDNRVAEIDLVARLFPERGGVGARQGNPEVRGGPYWRRSHPLRIRG